MYCITKLRLNRFTPSPCPSSRRLFQMFGFKPAQVESNQTADNIEQTIPFGAKKTQLLQLGNDMAAKAAEFVDNPKATQPLDRVNPREM